MKSLLCKVLGCDWYAAEGVTAPDHGMAVTVWRIRCRRCESERLHRSEVPLDLRKVGKANHERLGTCSGCSIGTGLYFKKIGGCLCRECERSLRRRVKTNRERPIPVDAVHMRATSFDRALIRRREEAVKA